ARLGGDEFTLLLPHISHRENAIRAADKIIQAFAAPFQIDGHELHVPMSIGIALYPEHGDSMDVLIKNADIAMYDSKAKGRNQFQIYDAEMSVSFDERFSLEMQMRKALEKEEFQVFYQPQVDLATGRISGMEALVRWLSPLRGYMLPAEFIPLAEETGLIVPIGEFVIRSVFRQAKLWKEAGLMPPRIAINLSSRHLEQAQLVGFIADLLQEYELPGSRFEIEITENTLLNDGEHILEKLKQLSEMGIRIALDDFGTGYSSLGYLKKFPIDTIKIDQSFMPRFSGDSDNESIVTAICTLAKSLDLRLIAEGVEKADQYQWLHQLNCNEAQGFLFSKPLASKDITDLLINKPPFSPTWT
ncbi:MAG: bifunctional diguanylate cyclase/phosphodiesterase, partial [Betaproteobacteria bacterium]|nr:bifunctional diguanylate cyclase/phosphodiesterase [Betaproteobacteria bacterium]